MIAISQDCNSLGVSLRGDVGRIRDGKVNESNSVVDLRVPQHQTGTGAKILLVGFHLSMDPCGSKKTGRRNRQKVYIVT